MRARSWTRALVVVAALAVVVPGTAVAATAARQAPGCASTVVFEADGFLSGRTLANWNGSRFNQAPPPGWEIVPVRYDADVFPAVERRSLDPSVAQGTAAMRDAVLARHRACLDARLVLAGFSEGAIVAGDALEGFAGTDEIPHASLSGVLYGNPRRPVGEGGTGGPAGGIETTLPTILPGVTMRGGHDYGDLTVRNVCHENDGICNSANPITNAAAFANGLAGYRGGDHAYDLDPAADLGSGLTFVRQAPRLPYGRPLPLAVGTPYELQRRLGGTAGRDRVAAALPAPDTTAGFPWYRLATAARS